MEQAMFGAGCFWGVEEAFRQIKGVTKAEVGYSGGNFINPGYRDVCSGETGHAEVIRVEFDPEQVSYETLLSKFWQIHDPTTLNRQGPDIGTQYRSVIFYFSEDQRILAEKAKQGISVNGRFSRPVVTEIKRAGEFYRAEEYHQQYLAKRGSSSCHI